MAEAEVKVADKFSLAASLGGFFNIRGKGFGDDGGKVTMGGLQPKLTAWRDDCIKGELPEDLKEGSHDVVIEPKKAAKQKATFKKNF